MYTTDFSVGEMGCLHSDGAARASRHSTHVLKVILEDRLDIWHSSSHLIAR